MINSLIYQVHKDGFPANRDIFEAWEYATHAGWETVPMQGHKIASHTPTAGTLISAGTRPLLAALTNAGILPRQVDYPIGLAPWMSRTVDVIPMGKVRQLVGSHRWFAHSDTGMFVKSVSPKLFTGTVMTGPRDLVPATHVADTEDMWVSSPIDLRGFREWRCYFLEGKVWDIRPYPGNVDSPAPTRLEVQDMLNRWDDQPVSGSLDVATRRHESDILIEATDGWSIGNYGMFAGDYMQVLNARWTQLHVEKR